MPERDVISIGEYDDGSRNEEGEALLCMVLGDLGAETDERIETGDLYGHLEEREAEEEQISEALVFLDDAGSSRAEPMRLYFREMHGNTLLTADCYVPPYFRHPDPSHLRLRHRGCPALLAD